MNKEKIIPNKTEVLIFSKYGHKTKPIMKGIIVNSKDSGDLSVHGSSWSVQIYEVLGDDGVKYFGTQEDGFYDYYFRTRENYVDYLNQLINHNNDEINKLKEKNKELKELIKNEYLENKVLQMRKCSHLFVKLKYGHWTGGFHSSDYEYEPGIFQCVHCGLTNKYDKECNILKKYHYHIPMHYVYNKEIFNKTFSKRYSRKGFFDESVLNLISSEVLNTNYSQVLYKVANTVKPGGTKEEIFEIMKDLNTLISEGKCFIETNDINELIDRYKKEKVKMLKHEKK